MRKSNWTILFLSTLLTTLLSINSFADPDRQWGRNVAPTVIMYSTNAYSSTSEGAERRLLINADGSINVSGITVAPSTSTIITSPVPIYDTQTTFISSGTSGKITSATSFTITPVDKVAGWSFLYKNNGDTSSYATIQPSAWGSNINITDSESDAEELIYPKTCNFTGTLPASATMTYTIQTVE